MALLVVAGALGVPATVRAQAPGETWAGTFDPIAGSESGTTTFNSAELRIGGGDARLTGRIEGDGDFDITGAGSTQSGDTFVCLELLIDGTLPLADEGESMRGPANLRLLGASGRCAEGGTREEALSTQVDVAITFSGETATGVVTGRDAGDEGGFAFTLRRTSRTGGDTGPGDEGGDFTFEALGALVDDGFIDGANLQALLGNTPCRSSDGRDPAVVERCRTAFRLGSSFQSDFAGAFATPQLLASLTAVAVLSRMPASGGGFQFPLLRRFTPVIMLLGARAQTEDDEASARAMRRLINLTLALDLAARGG